MQQQLPARAQRAAQPPPELVHLLGADVLDHPDRGDRVVGLPGEVAIVGQPEVHEMGDARLLGGPVRTLHLRRRDRDAGDVHAVALGGVDGERAPAGADVEHALAALEPELLADQLVLGLLRLLERRRAAREDRARVGHGRAEEEPEELRRHVVVVAHGAGVALARVEAPARRELGRRGRRRAHEARGARRGDEQARLVAAVELRRPPVVEQADDGVEVVDVERAGDVRTPEPELAGCAQEVRERLRRAGGEGRPVRPRRRNFAAVPQGDGEGSLGERVGERGTEGGGVRHPLRR